MALKLYKKKLKYNKSIEALPHFHLPLLNGQGVQVIQREGLDEELTRNPKTGKPSVRNCIKLDLIVSIL